MKTQSRFGVTIPSGVTSHVAATVTDSATIDFTASGVDNQTITADVILDPAADNITTETVSGIYTKLIDEVTYAELAALITGSDLIQGRQYLITDYQTVHTIPGTVATNTGPTEPLIVTAISVNELAPIAYSTLYPDDIIYYSHLNGNTLFPGSTKGVITRRVDTIQNNDIGTDWRHVKYRRYKVTEDTWDAGVTYAEKAVVKSTINNVLYISVVDGNLNNVVTDRAYWFPIEVANGSYTGITGTTWTTGLVSITTDPLDFTDTTFFATYNTGYKNNIIRTYELMNTLAGSSFYNNIIGSGFLDNCLLGSFRDNIILADFKNNITHSFIINNVRVMFLENILGSLITYNHIDYSFYRNIVGSSVTGNTIGNSCQENFIFGNFTGNTIGSNYYQNKIGKHHYNVTAGSDIRWLLTKSVNVASDGFQNVNISSEVQGTSYAVPLDFTSATHVYEEYRKEIFKRLDLTNRLRYTDNTDTTIVVSPTA
jgi:hypothetical protein